MLRRLASLRLWLLAAMVGAAIVGLIAANLTIGHIQTSAERSADRQKARATARALAAQAAAGASVDHFRVIQSALKNDQIVVESGGRTIFAGPPLAQKKLEVTASARFPGGRVVIHDHELGAENQLQLTLVIAAVLILLIAVAVATATLLVRAVRAPVERAVAAADRVAAGDLSARMGDSGPQEFLKLARAFDGMAARLESTDADQRQFLADIAHEIATPLNALGGYASALADGTVDSEPDRAEAAETIAEERERLKSLLEDLRLLTRLDLAEPVRVEPLDLEGLVRTLARRFARSARAHGLALDVRGEPVTVRTDRRLVETILQNLISNAIRYTSAGGRVELGVSRRRAELVVSVRDTGIGIAPEHQERIFDRLYRVDGARDRASGGSGLGLALARRAAQALHGRIELDSALGAGSEFRLVLPSY